MKKLTTLLVTLLISISSFSQNGINYKALIKDGAGNVVASSLVTVQFQILQGTGMTNVYQETHTPTTDANGIAIVNIGEGTPASGLFADIDWPADEHYLNVQINTGSGMVDMGTTQFKAVPYALSAANVSGLEQLDEGNGDGWRYIDSNPINYGNIGLNATDISFSSSFSSTRGATGDFSTAMGNGSTASGNYSTAMGNHSVALGSYSTATGQRTTASGIYSTAMGYYTIASAFNSFALGRYNTGGGSASSWLSSDPLFEIGNGTSTTPANALTVLKNGTITAPSFDLVEITDDKALTTKEYVDSNSSTGLEAIDEGNGIGWRLKDRNPAYYGNIGFNAIDLSSSYSASSLSGATGDYSTAIGVATNAESLYSFAMGLNNIGGGNASAWTWTDPLFEIGNGTSAIGKNNAFTVLKNGNVGIGEHQPESALEISFNSTTTKAQLSLKEDNAGYARLNFSNTNRITDFWTIASFIGTTTADDRLNFYNSDAGDILSLEGTGNVRVNGSIVHTSDKRLKKNIEDLSYGLDEVLQLSPKAYNWKAKPDQKEKSLGLIAQDVQKIIKEIVHLDSDEEKTLSISYTELIPVLIKAIQEQQEIIDSQNNSINKLTTELTVLKSLDNRVNQLEALIKITEQ